MHLDIKIWDGGLQEQEIKAIKTIEATFAQPLSDATNKIRGGTLRDQLRNTLKIESMFPWKGYAGFRFVDAKGQEGEFDLVIVTHCNVLIIELKDWNHEPVTAYADKWYKGDKEMGRSPVSITRRKKFLLENKLKPFAHRFTNEGRAPSVEFFVVMTGNAQFDDLPEADLHHTISLSDLLRLSDEHTFNKAFRPHPGSKVLNKDFPIFDELFLGKNVAPKRLRVNGYEAKEEIFVHPKKIYREFLAASELSKGSEALLRVWNFKHLEGPKALTPDGRAEIVSLEREVLQHINYHDRDLYNHCLRSLTSFQKDDVTSEYSEVYELPPSHVRLNEFIGKYCVSFSQEDRIKVVKLLIAKFADLHEIKIAHRDIGDHSLWVSPSKEVALSSFISAYHQPVGTVGDYRGALSVGALETANIFDSDRKLSPFQSDIHALGVIAWHLLSAKRISPKSLETIREDLLACTDWYGPALIEAVEAKGFQHAGDLFERLMQSEPADQTLQTFDDSELFAYRQGINHSRQFREDDSFIVETDEKEVYFSNGHVVKAWLNVGTPEVDPVINFHALGFLRRAEKLSLLNQKYIPKIRAFGIATKSSSLFLVSDRVEGATWPNLDVPDDKKLLLIEKLIACVEHLHSQGLSHGDLHPENVVVSPGELDIWLVDIPDFSMTGDSPKNHKYSPENIDHCTAFERDNFAVMRMTCDLLGMDWARPNYQYPHIASAVQRELEDVQFGFKDLGRFHKAFLQPAKKKTATIEVTVGGQHFQTLEILPDNGRLYLKIARSTKDANDVRVTFSGIGGVFNAFYSPRRSEFISAYAPTERDSVGRKDIDESQLELDIALKISHGIVPNLAMLAPVLTENDAFQTAIKQATALGQEGQKLDGAPQNVKDEVANRTAQLAKNIPSPSVQIKTKRLWQAILDTETESHPNIEVSSVPVSPDSRGDELIVPYESDFDALAQYDKSDEIEALIIEDENERPIGQVSLQKSALSEIRLTKIRPAARSLKEGDVVYFRTRKDQASFRKRKAALKRILDEESVIANLCSYFELSGTETALDYGIEVSDEDFSRYDRIDDYGNEISLNEQQRAAFRKLVKYGPLSLLQGPPGTGKTEFIAAFVHYLIEKQKANRILLVSQSHEAVNTAAERIRKHCARLNTSLEVVRFSNREGAVSTGLKDVYSHAITTERKELFNAEYKQRVSALSDALGIDSGYIASVVKAEMRLFKQIDQLNKLLTELGLSSSHEDDRKKIKLIAAELEAHIRRTLSVDFGIEISATESVDRAKELLISKLNSDYGVNPSEAKKARALAKISRDMLTALSGERVNYDEFFARSRQLVTGTCVGIGLRHIGIAENIYDWVIIDEAARSIASELAIAMQSGKRVLLVGDHLQLPPLYSDAHKKALARRLGIAGREVDVDEVLQSDFARAFTSKYGSQTGATLLTQYRMAPEIGNLVSQTFYGDLKNGDRSIPDIYDSAPAEFRSVVTWLDTAPLGKKSHHHNDKGVSIYNRAEADQIIRCLKEIAASRNFVEGLSGLIGTDEAAIGVICMYGEQKKLLRQKFSEVMWEEKFKQLVKIDTVDSYQGKENRVIILSLSRSSKDQNPGFLRTPNRINVAMSRAMDRLLIVGSADMWRGRNQDLPLGSVVKFMTEQGTDRGYRFIDAQEGTKTK